MAAGDACADAGIARIGGRGRGIRENAEVNVAQRAELGLEHDALAGLFSLIEVLAGIADVRRKLRAEFAAPRQHILKLVGFCPVDILNGQVLPLQNAGQPLFKIRRVQKLPHHDGLLLIFVGIDRRDAAQSGTVLLVLQPGLLQPVEGAVVREDDGGALGNFEILRRNGHARVLQRLNFTAQALQIDHDAVAQHVYNARQADAGGDEMKGEFAVLIHDGVARVVAALIPADDVIISCNEVDHPALALVAPVDAYDCAIAHNSKLLIRFLPQFLFYFFIPGRLYAIFHVL